ncbi:hypothetical protein [Plectonema phage JingP1]|uniref:Uncharacterized protein n=1 Tax=Plectonema phage JingP1 TaxID=2961687 RepID=A0A9E7NNF1_9CAUD|nr:hypothetical protein [Plectonema phage JingP1]
MVATTYKFIAQVVFKFPRRNVWVWWGVYVLSNLTLALAIFIPFMVVFLLQKLFS